MMRMRTTHGNHAAAAALLSSRAYQRRAGLEPPEEGDGQNQTREVSSSRHYRQDPPSSSVHKRSDGPSIELSARQQDLMQKRHQRKPSTETSARSTSYPSKQEDERPRGPSGTPSRTPNPVSRMSMGSTTSSSSQPMQDSDQQRAYLRKLLSSKASGSSASGSGSHKSKGSDDRAASKELLRRVLGRAKTTSGPRTLSASDNTHKSDRLKGTLASNSSHRPALESRQTTEERVLSKDESVERVVSRSFSSGQDLEKQPSHGSRKWNVRAAYKSATKARSFTPEDLENNPEYAAFLRTLRTEVSGQHSQLWESFKAVMQNDKRPPLGLPSKLPRAFKFDEPTRTALMAMNGHLKRSATVECVGSTQLVNDKKLVQEMQSNLQAASPLNQSSQNVVVKKNEPQRNSVGQSISKTRSARMQPPAIVQNDSESSNQTTKTGNTSFEPTRHRRESSKPSKALPNSTKSLGSDTILQQRSSESSTSSREAQKPKIAVDPILNTRSSSPSGDRRDEVVVQGRAAWKQQQHPVALEQHRSMGALTDTFSEDIEEDISPRSLPSQTNFEVKSDPGLEVTLGQFTSKLQQTAAPKSTSPSWTNGVQLRSVVSTNSVDTEASQESSPQPSWTKVRLRKVSRASFTSTDDASSDNGSDGILRKATTLSVDTSTSSESNSQCTPSSREQPSDPVPSPVMEGGPAAPIDLSLVPSANSDDQASEPSDQSNTALSDETVMIKLKRQENRDYSVVVGAKILRKVQLEQPGQKEVATVWSLRRSDVKSLTLDMSTLQVNLLLTEADSQKVLVFASSEDCLKFANAFYGQKVDESLGSSSLDETMDGDKSFQLESLNDEEQTLLEQYRKMRQNKPADAAMQELISRDHPAKAPPMSSLSAAEEELANKYRKMLKLSIPMDAVIHKMTRDGVDKKIFNAIAGGSDDKVDVGPPKFVSELPSSPVSTFSSSIGLSSHDHEVVESYRKMLRLHVPADAVRHKMQKDCVDAKIIEIVLGAEDASTNNGGLTAEEKEIAARYEKMLKMMIPQAAVRHKMVKDQVDQKIIDTVLGAETGVAASDTSSVMSKPTKRGALSDEEESVASQFRKMLKLQIPKDAVLTRMRQEGVSDKIITAVVGHQSSKSVASNDSKSGHSHGSKLVSLHWTPLSGKELDNSVWKASRNRKVDVAEPGRGDISQLIELFQKKTNTGMPKEKKERDDTNGAGKAKLLDLTRSNNVAISLKAFKDFSHRELADSIAFLDPLQKLRGERVQFVRDLLPTVTEVKIVKAYDGPVSRLVPAEVWFRHIVNIKRIETKVQVMRTMEVFETEAALLSTSLRMLTMVCHQVMDSQKLQDVLEMVLRIGNIMNEGTRTGGAAGFKFDSLLRLTQTKSTDGKTTVLDFLVNVFVAKGKRESLDLTSDFPECQTASRMLVSDLLNDVKTLNQSLEQCKQELKDLKNDLSSRHGGRPQISLGTVDSKSLASSSVDTVTLPSASPLPGKSNSPREASTLASANPLYSNPFVEKNSVSGGIARLTSFIDVQGASMAELLQHRDKALEACQDLSKYCGESGGHGATTTVLGVLAQFASNVGSALKKYDDKQRASQRKLKANSSSESVTSQSVTSFSLTYSEDSSQSNAPSETSSTHPETNTAPQSGTSLILMVNDLLRNANPRTKEDFKKGRVYSNPSTTLQAIYEKEKNLLSESPSDSRPKLDIMSTIQNRSGKIDSSDMQQVLSKFTCVQEQSNGPSEPTLDAGPVDISARSLVASADSVPDNREDSIAARKAMFEVRHGTPSAPAEDALSSKRRTPPAPETTTRTGAPRPVVEDANTSQADGCDAVEESTLQKAPSLSQTEHLATDSSHRAGFTASKSVRQILAEAKGAPRGKKPEGERIQSLFTGKADSVVPSLASASRFAKRKIASADSSNVNISSFSPTKPVGQVAAVLASFAEPTQPKPSGSSPPTPADASIAVDENTNGDLDKPPLRSPPDRDETVQETQGSVDRQRSPFDVRASEQRLHSKGAQSPLTRTSPLSEMINKLPQGIKSDRGVSLSPQRQVPTPGSSERKNLTDRAREKRLARNSIGSDSGSRRPSPSIGTPTGSPASRSTQLQREQKATPDTSAKGSPSIETAMLRMARLKREAKNARTDPPLPSSSESSAARTARKMRLEKKQVK